MSLSLWCHWAPGTAQGLQAAWRQSSTGTHSLGTHSKCGLCWLRALLRTICPFVPDGSVAVGIPVSPQSQLSHSARAPALEGPWPSSPQFLILDMGEPSQMRPCCSVHSCWEICKGWWHRAAAWPLWCRHHSAANLLFSPLNYGAPVKNYFKSLFCTGLKLSSWRPTSTPLNCPMR